MARQKISEYRAKMLLAETFDRQYHGLELDAQTDWAALLKHLPAGSTYVVKVDEGIKGRFKRGLVKLDVPAAQVAAAARELFGQQFRYVLVEPQITHPATAERYLCLERTRAGIRALVNQQGGVEVNAAAGQMIEELYSDDTAGRLSAALGLDPADLRRLIACFDDNYLGFLEINPLILDEAGRPQPLDAAIEVDGEAASLVAGRWSPADLRSHHQLTPQEAAIQQLAASSQSSFRLEVLNPAGQVFLLLSGGGASVTLADEVHNQGFGQALANYGEYSGNPTADETYVYAKQIISLLIESPAQPKVLIIAGGVANFTDIRVTFNGVIRALAEVQPELVRQSIKVFVRRGGPHEAEGLARMEAFLREAGLFGAVAGPELKLSEIIPLALAGLTSGGAYA